MNKIDWAEAKTAYITGEESYAALSARLGVSRSVLTKTATAQKWPKLRKDYREKTVTKAVQKASRAHARKLAKVYEASDMLDEALMAFLKLLNEDGLKTITAGGAPGRELESLTKALLNSDELKRRLNGMLMPRDAERMKLDREKLEIEKKKLAALEAENAVGRAVTVEYAGEGTEEYAQ
ncbi:MAG: hypothetical protein J6M10_03705 [Clostridia bacterium]|nr:hypothetical protein [Clostridia bacterium]